MQGVQHPLPRRVPWCQRQVSGSRANSLFSASLSYLGTYPAVSTMQHLHVSPTVAAALATLILWIFWKTFLEPSILPDLPIVGLDRSQWFAWPRTIHRAFNSYREIYGEAYEKVCPSIVFLLSNLGRGWWSRPIEKSDASRMQE